MHRLGVRREGPSAGEVLSVRPTAPTTALAHQSSAHTMESEARYMRRKVKAGLIEADHNEVRTHSFSGPPQHFFLAFRSLT